MPSQSRPRVATVDAQNALRLLTFARQQGLASPAPELSLPEGCARIPVSQMFAMWARVTKELGSPALPIRFAAGFRLDQLGLLGFVVLTAPTLRDSLSTFARYDALLNDGRCWALREQGTELTLASHSAQPGSFGLALSYETTLAQVVRGVAELGGGRPSRVRFRHAAPEALRAHRDHFGCALEFGAAEYAISFEREAAQAMPPLANRALWTYLCGQADRQLADLTPRPLREKVEHELSRLLALQSPPTMQAVARSLGLGERSLRRALATDGLRFRELLDDARKREAARLLALHDRTLSEISDATGFSDTSAFSHACRRWFGACPSALLERGRRER